MMNKKDLILTIFMLFSVGIALIMSLSTPVQSAALDEYYCNDNVYCFQADVVFPQFEINFLNGLDGVSVETTYETDDGDLVASGMIIKVNLQTYDLTIREIREYLRFLVINTENNQAQILIRPDALPPPLCLRDGINGQVYGIYLANGVFAPPIPNDPRCPE